MASSMPGPDLSPGRIDALSQWAQVAFAVRCALRVLPAALPIPTPRENAIKGFRAAQASCFIPMHVALSAGGRYQRLVDDASREVVELGQAEGRLRSARQCLAAAADLARPEEVSESADDEHGLRDRMAKLVAIYHDVAGAHEVYEPFEMAADADLAALATLRLAREAAVPSEFFARPLFEPTGTVPGRWQPVVKDWTATLAIVGLSSFAELYLRQCAGTPLSLAEIDALVTAWVQGSGRAATPAAARTEKRPQKEPEQPPLLMLADRPLEKEDFEKRDVLGFKDYAESLAVILDGVVATPFTMSINAPWGAGKTSLANMIAERLIELPKDRGDAPHIICHFNAWMHDDAPNLATALIAQVSRVANHYRPLGGRILLPMQLLDPNTLRRALFAFSVFSLAVALLLWAGDHLPHVERSKEYEAGARRPYQETFTATTDAGATVTSRSSATSTTSIRSVQQKEAAPPVDPSDPVLRWLQIRLVLLGGFVTSAVGFIGVLFKVLSSTSLASFVQSPEKSAEAGTIANTRDQLKRLIARATGGRRRLIVFVDDIERCKPPRSVDVLDAVNQLLDVNGVIVVLLGDMAAVAAAAQLKYKDLAEIYVPSADLAPLSIERRKEVFGRLYIQKIVQYQFDLPALPKEKLQAYVTDLLGTAVGARGE